MSPTSPAFPEIMDGRVKTLHPKVHGGLLAVRDNAEHDARMREHDIADIDLLVVNLYPFEETLAAGGDYDTLIENIDIGGPAMIRAAAKNHAYVTVVIDPADYDAGAGGAGRRMQAPRRWRRDKQPRRQGLCPHRRLRRGDRQHLARRRDAARRRPVTAPSAGVSTRHCAMARTRTSRRPSTLPARPARRAWPRRARSRARTVLQQHQRHRCGLRAGRRIRPEARRPSPSSSMPTRAAWREGER